MLTDDAPKDPLPSYWSACSFAGPPLAGGGRRRGCRLPAPSSGGGRVEGGGAGGYHLSTRRGATRAGIELPEDSTTLTPLQRASALALTAFVPLATQILIDGVVSVGVAWSVTWGVSSLLLLAAIVYIAAARVLPEAGETAPAATG
jgi:hypothetical protein